MIKKLKEAIFKIDDLACLLGNACIVFNMLIIVVNIAMRNLGSRSLPGITDYAGYISCLIVVLCLGFTESKNGNPKVDFIIGKFPVLVQKIVFFIVSVLDLIVGAMLSYSFFKYAVKAYKAGTTSMNAALPYTPFLIVCGIGMALFALTVIVKMVDKLSAWEGDNK